MSHGLPLDPHEILGLAPGATSQEVREAFRAKSKKHHPDLGGDAWAFRIVVRAFEVLNASNAGPGLDLHFGAARESPRPPSARPAPSTEATGQVRAGVRDRVADPAQLVAVELLRVRYEARDPLVLDTFTEPENPNLSGTLNLAWPDPEAPAAAARGPRTAEVIASLTRVFDEVRAHTPVVTSRSEVGPDGARFTGWLSYAGGEEAWQAFRVLREHLKRRGLGVRQWTRDLVIPRPA